jgi:hypothetical protein
MGDLAMNLFKMNTLIILLALSIDFARAAEEPNKGGSNLKTTYSGYNYSYFSNSSSQVPLTEKEKEFKKLEEDFRKEFHESYYTSSLDKKSSLDEKIVAIKQATELKKSENDYQKKFHSSYYGYDDKASHTQKIEMIKEAISLKDEEDAYLKKYNKDFRFSPCGLKTSYSTRPTGEKLKIIREETRYNNLLIVYMEESLEQPNISAATATTQPGMLKTAQIEALEEDIIIQLTRVLQSTYSDITEEYLKKQYSQLPAAENGLPTRSTIIEALKAEKQRRVKR